MNLSLVYLYRRHTYWRDRLGEAGIWNPELFGQVAIQLGKESKNFNGKFIRRIMTKGLLKKISDRIVIYNQSENFDPAFLDSVLVHEMIHQYIIQNNIHDTSTHGNVFKSFMHRINDTCRGELEIKIRDHNPVIPVKGAGNITHRLLYIEFENGKAFVSVIHPAHYENFIKMVEQHKKFWKIRSYCRAESNDVYFSRLRRCVKRLHGIMKPIDEMPGFLKEYNVCLVDR